MNCPTYYLWLSLVLSLLPIEPQHVPLDVDLHFDYFEHLIRLFGLDFFE